jgi:8-hydroxy-5-deazaflavin:NADPH oxidoreductase
MSYKTFVSMNIAVIGTGTHAETYAARYAVAGHEVFLAWKQDVNARVSRGLKAVDNINVCDIESAAHAADIIVITAAAKDVREVAYWLGDVRGKVIIDASASLLTGFDEQVNTSGAIRAITGSSNIVKVFNTRGYEQLLKPLFGSDATRLILAGDSKKAKEVTKIIYLDAGVNKFVDMGDNDSIPLFDEMTRCWRNLALKVTSDQPLTVPIS